MKNSPKQGYTIREISKKLSIPYSNINRAANSLIKEKILNVIDIGKAKYCTLNLESDETINLLCQISIKDKKKLIKAFPLDQFLKDIPDIKGVISVIFLKNNKTKSKVFIIVNKKDITPETQLNPTKIEYSILEADEFITLIKNEQEFKEEILQNSIILQGYENYWNLIKEAI